MKKLAFLCQKGLETFIEPVVKEFEKFSDEYQIHRYYCNTQAEVIAAVKWADVVFLEWANEIAIFATQIFDLRKKGVIVRLHSYEALSNMPQQVDWSVVDYLVFVAPHIREIVKRHIPDIEERVCTKIIPNGLDMAAIEPNKVLNMYDIAYVCNINHKKEPALALQIMAELVKVNPAFRLHVAGTFQDERYEIYMKHMAKEMGIENNIIYYGFVQDMDTYWQGKGVILSTSIHEGHPLNIMEGAARGLRPVVHNFYGAKDLYPKPSEFTPGTIGKGWLYNTVSEAVDIIVSLPKTNYSNDEVINWMLGAGWTLNSQIKQLKTLVDVLVTKESPVVNIPPFVDEENS